MNKLKYEDKCSIIVKIITIFISITLLPLTVWLNYQWVYPRVLFVPFLIILIVNFIFFIFSIIILKKESKQIIVYLLLISIFTISSVVFMGMIQNKFVGDTSVKSYLFGLLHIEPASSTLRDVAQVDIGKSFWFFDPCLLIHIFVFTFTLIDLLRLFKRIKNTKAKGHYFDSCSNFIQLDNTNNL